MSNSIYPCLWFNGNGRAAAEFYCSIFPHSKITADNSMVVTFEINGEKIMCLNGGPMFQLNQSISLFAVCETDDEINELWKQLAGGGNILMPLDKYECSERYGFVQDKFGVSWQLMKTDYKNVNQKITPCFLFVGDAYGKAEAAVKFYTRVFPQSKIEGIKLYAHDEGPAAGSVMHSQFILHHKVFMAMDGYGNHAFAFNEAFSLVVECDTQDELDFYWNTLTANGGAESMCGWLKDKFGVSWQIVPKVLGKLMIDAERGGRVMQALLKMKKIDIATLEAA